MPIVYKKETVVTDFSPIKITKVLISNKPEKKIERKKLKSESFKPSMLFKTLNPRHQTEDKEMRKSEFTYKFRN